MQEFTGEFTPIASTPSPYDGDFTPIVNTAGAGRGSAPDPRRLDTPTGIILANQSLAQSRMMRAPSADNSGTFPQELDPSMTSDSEPRSGSVLDGLQIPPPQFDPVEADKLSNAAYARSSQAPSMKPWNGDASPKSSGNVLTDVAANAAAGPAGVVLGQAESLGSILGMDNAASKVSDVRKDLRNWQNQFGGDTIAGKVADSTSAILYSMLATRGAGPMQELASNAGLFAIPAFNDTYHSELAQGKDEQTALAQALLSGTFNVAMPTLATKSGSVVSHILGTDGMNMLGRSVAETTSGGAVFGALGAANQLASKGIDAANGYSSQPFNSDQPVVDFITGALLHAAPHLHAGSGAAVDAAVGHLAPGYQAARELSRTMDDTGLRPGTLENINPNLRNSNPAQPTAPTAASAAPQESLLTGIRPRDPLTPAADPAAIAQATSVDEAIAAAHASVPDIDPAVIAENQRSNATELLQTAAEHEQARQELAQQQQLAQEPQRPSSQLSRLSDAVAHLTDQQLIDGINAPKVDSSGEATPGGMPTKSSSESKGENQQVQLWSPGNGEAVKGSVDFIKNIADQTGARVVLITGHADSSVNGFFTRDGVIYVDPARNQRATTAVFGHEFGHAFKAADPQAFSDLSNQLVQSGLISEQVISGKLKLLGEGGTRDEAIEEATSDLLGNRFNSKDFWSFLNAKNQPLFKKIYEGVKSFFGKLTKGSGKEFDTEVNKPSDDNMMLPSDIKLALKNMDDVAQKFVGKNVRDRAGLGEDKPKETLFDPDKIDDHISHSREQDEPDFSDVKDEDINAHGIQPEHAYPDIKYEPKGTGSTGYFRINGERGSARYSSRSMHHAGEEFEGKYTPYGKGDSLPTGFIGRSDKFKIDWNKRFASAIDLNRRGFDLNKTVDPATSKRIADTWKNIAKSDGAFEFKNPEFLMGATAADRIQEIATKMLDGTKYSAKMKMNGRNFEIEVFDKESGKSGEAYITYDPDRRTAVMHTMDLKQDSGIGKPVYQIGQRIAAGLKARIHPDETLIGANAYRRTEQMFSGQLRTGDSTMQAGTAQRIFGWDESTHSAANDGNLTRIALASTRNALEFMPELKKYGYNMETGKFFLRSKPDSKEGAMVAEKDVASVLSDPDARALGFSRSTLARAAVTLEVMDGEVKIPDKLAKPVLYSKESEEERKPVNVTLSAATDSIPGLKNLQVRANAGDSSAARQLNNIAFDSLSNLTEQIPSAKIERTDNAGLYFGELEPSLGLRVSFNAGDKSSVLASLAKFADNFNQHQIHVRQDTNDKAGTVYPDGSFATPEFSLKLKNPLSREQVQDIVEKSGLVGLSYNKGELFAYYIGAPNDRSAIEQFTNNFQSARDAAGDNAEGVTAKTSRLWAYGNGDVNGEPVIPYSAIDGDISTRPAQANKTANRVAEDVAGRPVTPAEQKDITEQQGKLQRRIRDAYEAMPMNDLGNPDVRHAYDALGTEVKHQFEKMPAKVEIWHGNDEPYKNSQAMRQDIQDNNHLYIYATDADHFGPPGIEYKNHPLLEQSGMRDINGIPLLYNDLLRAVHDYYAHTLSPVAFGPKGEEAAWKNHVEMTNDPWARWALTSETRGQNSWVNFRDGIQDVPLKERGFGEQKVGLLPIEFAMSGTKQDASMRRLADQIGADRSRGSVPDGWEKPDTSEQFTPAKGAVNYGTPTDGSVQAVGHHFSTAQRSNLNSDYFGTGLKGLERERLSDPANSDIKSRLNFYVDKGQGVHPEFGVGSVEHQVNLNNLYDTRKDPLGLIKNAKGVTSADRSSHWERAIRKAGYDGYLADTGGHQAFAVLIGKHNIDMSGNKLSREKDDLFQDDFANKKTTVDTGIKISSNGETLKGGNVDSEGRQITATKQGLKNFWNWFGESEATDDSGKPMVLYHSTNADTNVLKDGQKTTNNYGFLGDVELSRSGIFLSPDRNFSQEYLRDGEGKNVMPLYARLEKPLDLRSGMTPEVENELVDAGINRRWLFDYRQHDWEMFDNADDGTNHFVDTLKRLGYDGAIFNEEGQDEKSHETYVAFDGSQLKSATGNKGTFDGSSSDIRQSREEDVPLSTRRIMESDDKDARASLGLNTDNSGRQANDVRSIAHTLNGKTLAEHGPMNDQSPTPGDSDRIASAMADEVHWQVAHSPKEDTGTGLGWYSHNYPNAVRKLSRRFPELATNEHAQSVFTALVAITSNGEKVAINIQNAIDLYSKLRVGKELVGVGSRRAGALENNLAQLERLLSVHGDGLKQHLLEVTTVGDMNKMLRAMGEKPDGSYTADTEVPRAAIYFGPKLGAFYANLSGSEGYLTMDLWWSRSINRMRGLLIPKATDASIGKFRDIMSSPDASREEVVQSTKPLRDQYKQQGWTTELEHLAKGKEPSKKDEKEAWFSAAKKAAGDGYEQLLFEHNAQKMANTIYKNEFDMLAEAPFRATDRDFMYESARKAQSILDDKGVKLSLADIQAALWYYEKRLYQKLSGRKADDIGYEEAINQQASASNRPERPSVVFAAKPDGGTDSAAAGGKTDQVQQHAEDGEPKLSREQEVEGRENEHPGLVSNLIHYSLEDLVDKAGDKTGVYDTLAPMSSGTQRTRALAQQWINKSRTAEWGWSKIDKAITDNFTEHQRWKMWEAADEENDYRRNGIQTDGTGRGLDSLTPQERSVVDDLHHYSVELWNRAKAIGMVQGDGVDFWTPRMMVVIGANGEYEAPSEGKQGTSEGIGKNFTTSASSTKSRKYELSTDTEAAMVAKGGALVRDIRTMPMAMAKMEKAIAGRELINQIKAIGVATGKATVSSTGGDGFFTLDHPAFKTYGPRFDENGIVLKEDGAPVIDPKPIFISNDFKGPLKAILSQNLTANKVYTGYMLLKSKAMSAIMYSPLIHNQVILGRALAYGGLRTPLLYFTGNAAKNDTAFMRKMIDSGMVPIGSHNNMLDVGDIARGNAKEGGWLDPNESWITKSLQVVGNKAKDGLGDSIKRGMDYAGDVLHNKLLWERVGDLQAGIAQDVYQKLSKKGLDDNAASTVAAHIANRYAGAIGKESMSELSHVIANITLFSKSFNAGNIGTVKDAFFGLPAGLKSQLNENSSAESAAKALNFSKNKARIGLVRDAAYAIMLTSLVQDWVKRDKNKSFGDQVSDGLEGYQKRAAQAWANAKDNPLTMSAYNPYRLSSTWGNEPNKRDRVDMGEQDGGRHEYMRLPTGKVVEDILGWTTHPWDTADKKKSPLMSALQRMRDVKDPYGTPVMDPNGSLPSKVWDMAKALVGTHMPLDQLQTAKDIAVGVGTKLDKDKMIGNITGLSYSQGNPQGPEAAVAYATADRVMAEKKYAMEYVKRDLKNGEEDAARARLEKIGLTGKEITHIINKIQNPKSHMSASQRKSFNAHATDEERADMETVGQ